MTRLISVIWGERVCSYTLVVMKGYYKHCVAAKG